jgi:hypothetical protein
VILVSRLHCYRAKLFRFESDGRNRFQLDKLMMDTAIHIVEGVCKLIYERNLMIVNPSFILGSLIIAAATESRDPARDTVYFRRMIINMINSLKECHNLKIVGSKADADRAKLSRVWLRGLCV